MSIHPSAYQRSFLFVPGNHPRRFQKALDAGADAVIFDLEDAVPVTTKDVARAAVALALTRHRRCRAYVRVNGIGSGLLEDDLGATVGGLLDGIVLPKVESAEELRTLLEGLERLELDHRLGNAAIDVIALIETARGLHRLEEIATASPRLTRLAFGAADYVNDLGLLWTEDEGELAHARALLTHASRRAGLLPPIDAVLLQVKDLARFRASARRARSMGFAAKLCIHPDQIASCNACFTPSAAEIEHALRVVEAFESAEEAGSAAIQVAGQLVDYAVVNQARRILAQAGFAP